MWPEELRMRRGSMRLIEKLTREAHREWVERFAVLHAGRPMDETEKRSLGRVPFEAAFEAGFRAAREMAARHIEEGETNGSDCGIRKLGEGGA
jgi:hypothetical protein